MRLFAASLFAGVVVAMASVSAVAEEKSSKVLDHKMKAIDGKEVNLAEKYKGKVLLVVNVASQCGATPQYKQLEGLQDTYHAKGLEVVGFPCNQFGGQEPGSEEEIVKFCKTKYDVSFDLFTKIDVNIFVLSLIIKHCNFSNLFRLVNNRHLSITYFKISSLSWINNIIVFYPNIK